jgi:NitT/TauT family transport system substrate-binding protein
MGLASLLAVLVLVLAACGNGGDGDDAGAGEDAGAAGGGEPEVTELTIGTLPIVDVAPLQVAVDEGYFEEEGLEVTLETMQGGAAAIPGLVNGELDVTFGAWVSFFQAITEGIELRAIANGVRAQEQFTMVLTGPDSDLADNPAGLEGRTVAVNTLNNLGELAVRSAVQEAGGDPDAVELTEIPFPDMLAALEQGNVDAIWAVEPFTTRAQQELGAVPVVDSYLGPLEQFPVAGFQATAEFVESNPNTVAAVQRALAAATEAVNTESDRLTQEILPDLAGLEPEVAEALHLPEYISELDPDELQRVVDYTYEFGILAEQLQASDYIVAQ